MVADISSLSFFIGIRVFSESSFLSTGVSGVSVPEADEEGVVVEVEGGEVAAAISAFTSEIMSPSLSCSDFIEVISVSSAVSLRLLLDAARRKKEKG